MPPGHITVASCSPHTLPPKQICAVAAKLACRWLAILGIHCWISCRFGMPSINLLEYNDDLFIGLWWYMDTNLSIPIRSHLSHENDCDLPLVWMMPWSALILLRGYDSWSWNLIQSLLGSADGISPWQMESILHRKIHQVPPFEITAAMKILYIWVCLRIGFPQKIPFLLYHHISLSSFNGLNGHELWSIMGYPSSIPRQTHLTAQHIGRFGSMTSCGAPGSGFPEMVDYLWLSLTSSYRAWLEEVWKSLKYVEISHVIHIEQHFRFIQIRLISPLMAIKKSRPVALAALHSNSCAETYRGKTNGIFPHTASCSPRLRESRKQVMQHSNS